MFITNSLNKWWISAYFFLPFTCYGIIFLHLKWPAYTWTTQQRKHPPNPSLCILLGFERGVNEICAFGGDLTQRRLILSCRRFGTTVGGGEILTAVLVKIQVIWDVSPCWLVSLPASLGQQPKMSHFLFLPPILDFTEAGAFLFCDFTEYCPRGEKKFAPFSYVCLGFTSQLLVYLNMLWMQ